MYSYENLPSAARGGDASLFLTCMQYTCVVFENESAQNVEEIAFS